MIIYVNGDSHSAAAEAVVPYGWAEDDPFYYGLGKRPHPENERASFGCEMANELNAILECQAQAGASNARILRTTRDWIDQTQPSDDTLIIIQWSTWEREEWLIDGEYYQVGASGTDSVPQSHQDQYREFVQSVDWDQARQQWHREIWSLHQELQDLGLRHLFFNGNSHFEGLLEKHDWGSNYMNPYDANLTYDAILRQNGYKTVNKDSWHFGEDAHRFWAQVMLKYAYTNNLIS